MSIMGICLLKLQKSIHAGLTNFDVIKEFDAFFSCVLDHFELNYRT